MIAALLSQYTQSVLTTGAMFAIAGMGLYVTLSSGQFSVVHAALMGLGGYAAGVGSVELGCSYVVSLLIGALAGGFVGVLLGVLLHKMDGMLLGIATLAIGQAIALTVVNIDYLGGSVGYAGVPLRTTFSSAWLILGLAMAGLMYMRRTRFGLAVLAVGKDATVAEALGISAFVMRVWAFGVGGALAGLAGAMLIQFVGLIQPNDLAFPAEVQLFIYVVVGGLTTPWGAAVGAVGILWLLEALRFSVLDRYWILGLILVVVVLVRPKGLLVRRSIAVQPEAGEQLWRRLLAGRAAAAHGPARAVTQEAEEPEATPAKEGLT
jgi:branched-chain amino acid transport system permease protein